MQKFRLLSRQTGFAFLSNNNLRREKSFQYSITRALFFALKRKNLAKMMIFTISIAKMCKNGTPTLTTCWQWTIAHLVRKKYSRSRLMLKEEVWAFSVSKNDYFCKFHLLEIGTYFSRNFRRSVYIIFLQSIDFGL